MSIDVPESEIERALLDDALLAMGWKICRDAVTAHQPDIPEETLLNMQMAYFSAAAYVVALLAGTEPEHARDPGWVQALPAKAAAMQREMEAFAQSFALRNLTPTGSA